VRKLKLPSAKYLRECFLYNPETGQIFWKNRPRKHFDSARIWNSWNGKHAGRQAFTSHNQTGHSQNFIDGTLYMAHRVIWKLITGRDPADQIDHKNRNPADNRWHNLRQATHAQNAQNRKPQVNNTSGRTGVYQYDGKWKAFIRVDRKQISLGTFCTMQEAIFARASAEQTHYGEFRA
jgi:hypothetical protein